MDRGPVVGVVAHGYGVPRPFGALPVTGSPDWYVDGLVAAGARPVLLPGSRAFELLDLVDGLVLTGGGDVDPALSGAVTASDVDRARDEREIATVRAAATAGVPTLGVCRGLQVLAVAFGGSLVAGVEHVLPHSGHDVTTAPGSLVRGLVGARVRTSALHHHAIGDPGPCWRPTAWADDGVVEAVEWSAGGWPALGVQWHPELRGARLGDHTGPALFRWLRDAARGGLEISRRAGASDAESQHRAGVGHRFS